MVSRLHFRMLQFRLVALRGSCGRAVLDRLISMPSYVCRSESKLRERIVNGNSSVAGA